MNGSLAEAAVVFFNAHPLGDIHQDDRRSLYKRAMPAPRTISRAPTKTQRAGTRLMGMPALLILCDREPKGSF
jgi:hypothetical protein